MLQCLCSLNREAGSNPWSKNTLDLLEGSFLWLRVIVHSSCLWLLFDCITHRIQPLAMWRRHNLHFIFITLWFLYHLRVQQITQLLLTMLYYNLGFILVALENGYISISLTKGTAEIWELKHSNLQRYHLNCCRPTAWFNLPGWCALKVFPWNEGLLATLQMRSLLVLPPDTVVANLKKTVNLFTACLII